VDVHADKKAIVKKATPKKNDRQKLGFFILFLLDG
jgi:hypothetical protein